MANFFGFSAKIVDLEVRIISRIYLGLLNAYKVMCFDRIINGNRDVKFLECNYLLVQQCVKLILVKSSSDG